ncbi:hypothetical protein ACFVWG_20720 [Kribbella sp. NPDC058245]|uniref:hypothetical protein n=1 Tax=Kribbella sp. NPDC058245 TaxID=3346399 RepID=UPI0036EAE57E
MRFNLNKIGVIVKLVSRRLNDSSAIGDLADEDVAPDRSSWDSYVVAKSNPYNASRFSTSTGAALKVLDSSTDQAKRLVAMRAITQAIATDLPYIGLAQPNFAFAVAPGATFTKEPDFMDVSTGNWIHYLKSTE